MKKIHFLSPIRPILLSALLLSIPAFYLILPDTDPIMRMVGHMLYGLVAALIGVDMVAKTRAKYPHKLALLPNDWILLAGALLSAWPSANWLPLEWTLRLGYALFVFIRLAFLCSQFVSPNRLLQIVAFGLVVLGMSGAGFLLLDPQIHTYGDGVWLAFTTGATVGYGDLVPSTTASRIFSVFIVLFGYALFSVVTASIAALLVGEDEKEMRKEMHADMRHLRREIDELRKELRAANVTSDASKGGAN
jgi:voltage-gated potassium channel